MMGDTVLVLQAMKGLLQEITTLQEKVKEIGLTLERIEATSGFSVGSSSDEEDDMEFEADSSDSELSAQSAPF